MKKIQSAIFDSIRIKDINLTLHKNDIVEIPDDLFKSSNDIKNAIKNNLLLCDGMAHKGKIVKLGKPRTVIAEKTIQSENNSIENRINILEKSVSLLLSKDNKIPETKYEDYILYMGMFLASDFDAMIIESFIENRRNINNPGDAKIENGCLISESENFSSYNSQIFELEQAAKEILPMIKWSEDGLAQMYIQETIPILNLETNLLGQSISIDPSNQLMVTIGLKTLPLKATYNCSKISSFCILIKF